ncbi:recombinase family protein [Streptomyces sp. NPDC052043]|uniref:recombinase family protein n=1 Tax=Streptomyces sp. NPDC052043 TaxID=3365684 RepID=UPI0037D0701D
MRTHRHSPRTTPQRHAPYVERLLLAGERDFGDLGVGDPAFLLGVPDGTGVLDRRPGVLGDARMRAAARPLPRPPSTPEPIRDQGHYLGGRPPYGYRLINAGPHPNRALARRGVRIQLLDTDPECGPIVSWIFAQRLAGHSIARITRALNDARIPSPSATDRARNPPHNGQRWVLNTVRAILTNPRYTGRQVWNRQRTDHDLFDSPNTTLGHREATQPGPGRAPNAYVREDQVLPHLQACTSASPAAWNHPGRRPGEAEPKTPQRQKPAPAGSRKRAPMPPAQEQGAVGALCPRGDSTTNETVVVAQGQLRLQGPPAGLPQPPRNCSNAGTKSPDAAASLHGVPHTGCGVPELGPAGRARRTAKP